MGACSAEIQCIAKQEKMFAGLDLWAGQLEDRLGEFNASWMREWEMSRKDWADQEDHIGKLETRIKNLEENASDEQDWTTLR
jgi:hypothetical protein